MSTRQKYTWCSPLIFFNLPIIDSPQLFTFYTARSHPISRPLRFCKEIDDLFLSSHIPHQKIGGVTDGVALQFKRCCCSPSPRLVHVPLLEIHRISPLEIHSAILEVFEVLLSTILACWYLVCWPERIGSLGRILRSNSRYLHQILTDHPIPNLPLFRLVYFFFTVELLSCTWHVD
jgi:hypothetical protein